MNLSKWGLLCLLPMPACAEWVVDEFNCVRCYMETSFEAKVPVSISYSYPILNGHSLLIEHVNHQLHSEAENRFKTLQISESSSEEDWEDGCTFEFGLFPVYQTSHLVSIYGSDFQGRGCHGCTYYEGKKFLVER